MNCRRSLVYFTVPPLRLSSVCGVFFHLPGGTDERFGAGRVHLRLHGLLREEGERRTCTKPSPPPLSFKHFKFIVRCFAVSPGRASHEHGLRGDDVLLGGRPSLPPLPHYHPPHVQRVSSSRPALLRAHRVLIKNLLIFCPRRKSYRSLALLWAGSSMAHQIVLVPGVVVGECHLHESTDPSHHYPCCLWFLFSMNDVLVPAGKYGSNIRPAFWRNIPFFLAPFWAASVLFSRPREMPIVTADKVG